MEQLHTSNNDTDLRHFFHTFFTYYLIDKHTDTLSSMVADDISFVLSKGTFSGYKKSQFLTLLPKAFAYNIAIKSFQITQYQETHLPNSNISHIFCTMEKYEANKLCDADTITSYITMTVMQTKHSYVISQLHISDIENTSVMNNYLGLYFAPNTIHHLNKKSRNELMKVLSEMLPVGIIGIFLDYDFSLFVINDKMLEMIDYTYEEYLEATHGQFGNSIHPEDMYIVDEILNTLKNSDSYDVEYRIRRKDGSYIWIHDMGRKIITDDGREAIICGLIDITKRMEDKLNLYHETLTDPLTKAYNRKGANLLVNQKLQSTHSYSFLAMDIDNFKSVNDIYGHAMGDELLVYISKLLTTSFRESDIIIRLGGDEFALFLDSCSNKKILEKKLNTICKLYKEKVLSCCPNSHSTLSFGGVIGTKNISFEELYLQADAILYKIKKTTKNGYLIKDLQ